MRPDFEEGPTRALPSRELPGRAGHAWRPGAAVRRDVAHRIRPSAHPLRLAAHPLRGTAQRPPPSAKGAARHLPDAGTPRGGPTSVGPPRGGCSPPHRRAAAGAGAFRTGSAEVGAERVGVVDVVEVDRAGLAEAGEVQLVVPGHLVHLRLRLVGGLDRDVTEPRQAGAGRDELADDDVLLEPHELIAL